MDIAAASMFLNGPLHQDKNDVDSGPLVSRLKRYILHRLIVEVDNDGNNVDLQIEVRLIWW